MHANARLTVHGRYLLVSRVRRDHRPVAHVAKELGVSRQCAHRWVARFDAEGLAGLADRSSRPASCPRRTSPARELTECDPLTGAVIRASRSTARRYERDWPGDLIHIDVKKIRRIPDGRRMAGPRPLDGLHRRRQAGPDRVRLRPLRGIGPITDVMTDNHWSYTRSTQVAQALADLGARHLLIRAPCPWQNGKIERFNRTLQIEWAYRQIFTSTTDRAAALAPWLHFYNTERPHTALHGQTPTSRIPSPTS